MRIEHVEQRLGNLRKFVLELQPGAGIEQGERFDEPRDVRVLRHVLRQPEPPGNLRMGFGELSTQIADEGQFAVVVAEKLVHVEMTNV